MERPCLARHPLPRLTQDACRLCYLAEHDGRYQSLWGIPVTAPAFRPLPSFGAVVRVNFCASRNVWDWAVTQDGRTVASGSEKTEAEARAEAEAAKPAPPAFRWISTARLAADAVRLAGMLPPDCGGVVGVPRSGMVPAAVIATVRHLPLFELDGGGYRPTRTVSSRGGALAEGPGPLAVIDDTVYSGAAFYRARQAMRGRSAVYAAVYVRPEAHGAADLFAVELPSPHLLEWNVVNSGPFVGNASNPVYGRGISLDLDGVIVHDADSGGRVGTGYLVPRFAPCRLIATGRHERDRAVTEAMLRSLGVRWERLEMLPDAVPLSAQSAAEHKAKYYRECGCGFFVESDPIQAEMIHRLSGRPVICPRADRVFH